MLLAKLRYAVLGVVTLALVSTSVGVVAQTAPDGPPATDRLKAVEQKLDRLLEVLGGSNAATVSRTINRAPTAQGQASIPGADTVNATFSASPSATALAPAIAQASGASTSTGTTTLARGDVIGRVDRLERKLNELELRFGALERRLNESHSRAPQPPGPAGVRHYRNPGASSDAPPPPPGASFFRSRASGSNDRVDRSDLSPIAVPETDLAPAATDSIPSSNASSSSSGPAADFPRDEPQGDAPPSPR
jgi:hypothetical protein